MGPSTRRITEAVRQTKLSNPKPSFEMHSPTPWLCNPLNRHKSSKPYSLHKVNLLGVGNGGKEVVSLQILSCQLKILFLWLGLEPLDCRLL